MRDAFSKSSDINTIKDMRNKMQHAGRVLAEIHVFIRDHEFNGEDRDRTAIFTKIEEAYLRVTGQKL